MVDMNGRSGGGVVGDIGGMLGSGLILAGVLITAAGLFKFTQKEPDWSGGLVRMLVGAGLAALGFTIS